MLEHSDPFSLEAGGSRTEELLQRWSRTTNPPRTVAEVLAIQNCPCLERNEMK